jgi:hypothetical protein
MTSSLAVARPNHPIGVWLLSAYALLIEGLFPASAMALFILGALRAQLDPSGAALFYFIIVRLLVNLGVIAAVVSAFLGGNIARWCLLFLVTLNHVLAIQNLPLLLVGPLPREALPGLCEGALKQVVVPAVYIWYFTRRQTRLFYERSSTPADLPPGA